jgi:DNA-binding MarR family transcriptional regulator
MDESPGLALARAGQVASTRIRQALLAHGLKVGHAHVLRVLADEGATGQQALVEALGVDPSVLVAMLNDLEKAGLAERRRDTADRRRHIVEISPRGMRLVADADASIASAEAELFANLDASEISTLHGLLARIKDASGDPGCDGAEVS